MLKKRLHLKWLIVFGMLYVLSTFNYAAEPLTLSAINFTSQSSERLEIQIDLSNTAIAPKVFKTDNPARIVLDFVGVKNGLTRKIYYINQGAVLNAYVVEADGRVRVVLNLLEVMPYEIKTDKNKVFLTLTPAAATRNVAPSAAKQPMKISSPAKEKATNAVVAAHIPEQTISGFDFKRGDKGEGRILVSLANKNTVVNSKKENGKVVINFLNTQLPEGLAKRLDVSEFATPVKFIDTVAAKQETTLTITTVNDLYDYSVFQTDGMLTVEFRPLSDAEKEKQEKSRVKYTGDRLSLNFQDIEIRSIIAILAEFTGQNMVAGEDVSGNITLKLDDVPWDEALDFIMMTKELGKYQTGNVILISPLDKIKDYKEKQQKMEEVVEKSDSLITEYIKINFAKAESFKSLLNGMDTGAFGTCGASNEANSSNMSVSPSGTSAVNAQEQALQSSTGGMSRMIPSQQSMLGGQNQIASGINPEENRLLSTRGSAIVDSRTNTLIIKDTAKKIEDVKHLIHKLDVPVQQVMIESRIVIADDSFAKNLGVKFGAAKQGAMNSRTGYAVGGTGTKGSMNSTDGSLGTVNDSLVDLGVNQIAPGTPYGALGMTLARGADYVLNLEVQALQTDGRGESISNPRVMTMNRCTAHIVQGVQVPYVTLPTTVAAGSSSTTVPTVTFKDATLALNVTPQITPSGSVLMNLVIKKDNVNEAASIGLNGNKVLDKREIQTSVLVEDGETIVLGGVYEDNDSFTKNKVPFFADLPLVGDLFSNSANKNTKKELLIFVTPKIIKDNQPAQ
ncbi:MAG: type IV pilus secretin PilQ [Methylococcales bacterium]|nr:type IV pilus secretin PilQ [Methylococcales bacterium]